jgi:hypothetical protein
LANLRKVIPPASSLYDTLVIILVFVNEIYENWLTEIEYDEKRIIVEDVDEGMMGSIAHGLHCLVTSVTLDARWLGGPVRRQMNGRWHAAVPH